MHITVNGKEERLDGALTVAELIHQLELQPNQVAVEVNMELVPRQVHAQRSLLAGDQIEIVTFVGGG